MFRLLKLWKTGGRDLRLLWFALRHPARPGWLWPAALILLAYALDPFNFAIPALGVVDDLILLPLIVHLVVSWLPSRIRNGYEASAFGSR